MCAVILDVLLGGKSSHMKHLFILEILVGNEQTTPTFFVFQKISAHITLSTLSTRRNQEEGCS